MKKSIVYLSIIGLGFAAACQQEPEGIEAKREQLAAKQESLEVLQTEIEALKAEIAEMDTTISEDKPILVQWEEIRPATFKHYIEVTGVVSSKENILVSAEASGRVVAVPGVEGQKVGRGTVLVRLDNQAISQQLSEAKAAYQLAKTTWEKRKRLWEENKIGSEIEYLQAKTNFERAENQYGLLQTQYNNSFIKAPINGTVDNISVKEGEFVNAGMPIARVVDLERVEVEAEISEEYLSSIQKNDSVLIRIPAIGLEQKERIDFVGQVINPDNRSFAIKINLNNKGKRIKPNALVNLSIKDYQADEAIVLPSLAVRKDLKGNFVFVAVSRDGKMVSEKRYVKMGKAFNESTEILSGLEAGDRVIVSGFNQVSQGASVTDK